MRWWPRPLQQKQTVISQSWKQLHRQCSTTVRTVHTGTPSFMVAKLLTADELFAKTSLREYLKKMENEYSDCLQAVNGGETEERCTEDELRAKRTKLSLLAPLIQSIRQLESKQREMAETVTLLKGEAILLSFCVEWSACQ